MVDGSRNGFNLHYAGLEKRQSRSQNIPFSVGNATILWNKLMKEVHLKRVAGPYDKIPFQNYIQSPIGLVPKTRSEQTRLIFHLSYKFGDHEDEKSVNACTPRELCSVVYNDLDHAVQSILIKKEKEYTRLAEKT